MVTIKNSSSLTNAEIHEIAKKIKEKIESSYYHKSRNKEIKFQVAFTFSDLADPTQGEFIIEFTDKAKIPTRRGLKATTDFGLTDPFYDTETGYSQIAVETIEDFYNTKYKPKGMSLEDFIVHVTSHEFGHMLGLPHYKLSSRNLLSSGPRQIKSAIYGAKIVVGQLRKIVHNIKLTKRTKSSVVKPKSKVVKHKSVRYL